MSKKHKKLRDENTALGDETFRNELLNLRNEIVTTDAYNHFVSPETFGRNSLSKISIDDTKRDDESYRTVMQYSGNFPRKHKFSTLSLQAQHMRSIHHQKRIHNTKVFSGDDLTEGVREILNKPREKTRYERTVERIHKKQAELTQQETEKQEEFDWFFEQQKRVEETIKSFGFGIEEEKPETRSKRQLIMRSKIRRFGEKHD